MSEPAHDDVQNNNETTPGGVTGKGFVKGQSGNPAGRPKGIARVTREVIGDDGETIVRFWAGVMAGGALPDGRKPTVQESLVASRLLAERGWGKPPQFAPIEDDDPLDFSERETLELAASFDARLDELAARREKKSA